MAPFCPGACEDWSYNGPALLESLRRNAMQDRLQQKSEMAFRSLAHSHYSVPGASDRLSQEAGPLQGSP